MVVAGRNPAGVLSGQRLPCHSVFSHSGFSLFNPRFSFQACFPPPYLFNTIYYRMLYLTVEMYYTSVWWQSAVMRRKSDGNSGAS